MEATRLGAGRWPDKEDQDPVKEEASVQQGGRRDLRRKPSSDDVRAWEPVCRPEPRRLPAGATRRQEVGIPQRGRRCTAWDRMGRRGHGNVTLRLRPEPTGAHIHWNLGTGSCFSGLTWARTAARLSH